MTFKNYTKQGSSYDSIVYEYNFCNLKDLYNYLIENPEINRKVFSEYRASEKNDYNFSGESLDKSIEYLRGGYQNDFDRFDIEVNNLRKLGYQDDYSTKFERCIHGGSYFAPLVAAGAPDCMIRYAIDTEPKHISVYFQLGYPHYITSDQIFNRGVATINLIQLLEEKGYIVDLKVFELSKEWDEIVNIIVNIKRADEFLNISKVYYPFVAKEFLRRLLFRVLESMPVKNGRWSNSYGRSLESDEIRKFYKLRKKDLVIPAPNEIGIKGLDIYEDTYTLFKFLGLEEEFDLSKLNQKVKKR